MAWRRSNNSRWRPRLQGPRHAIEPTDEEALRMLREVYAARSRLYGPRHGDTLLAASNLSDQLVTIPLWAEAEEFLREQIPLALEALGPDDVETLKMRGRYAIVLGNEGNHTEAVAILEDVAPRCRRIFGNDHPLTAKAQYALGKARERLSHS